MAAATNPSSKIWGTDGYRVRMRLKMSVWTELRRDFLVVNIDYSVTFVHQLLFCINKLFLLRLDNFQYIDLMITNINNMAISMNIDANLWLLTNNVPQIHMIFCQHLVHQNMNIVEFLNSYWTIPSSLHKIDPNHLFVNSQPLASIFIEIAI